MQVYLQLRTFIMYVDYMWTNDRKFVVGKNGNLRDLEKSSIYKAFL